jgi:hypothetical protein
MSELLDPTAPRPGAIEAFIDLRRPAMDLRPIKTRVQATSPPIKPMASIDPDTFVTLEQLARDTAALAAMLPPDVDAVVAIARSGLLVGGPLATLRHVPLYTVSRQRGVLNPGHGVRLDNGQVPRHVALVDDTAAHGREMAANLPTVRAAFPNAAVTRTVVYCAPQARRAVDLCVAIYPGAHYLAWNWCNAGHGAACGYDFDGILCADDSDRPLCLPRRLAVPLVVTGRHESARGVTEAWLARWGVRVERLVMRDFDAPDVFDVEEIARFKARHYRESACTLFAESDPAQAQTIADRSGKPVLCPQAGRVLRPRPDAGATPELLREVLTCPDRRRVGCTCRGVFECQGTHQRVTLPECLDCLET